MNYCNRIVIITGTIPITSYCTLKLTKKSLNAFKYAVINHYWYQMYIGEYCVVILTIGVSHRRY